jgi:hypothetical protein
MGGISMCYGEHYRKAESFNRIIIGPIKIVEGTGMSYYAVQATNVISKIMERCDI